MEPKTERKGLGQVIRTLRELNELSRADLAARAGLGADMIAKIEQGAKSPSTSALKRIAAALGVDTVDLSQRGAEWARLMSTAAASTAALRSIAVGVGAGVALGLLGGAAAGPAGVAAGAVALNRLDRQRTETALRTLLEQRLADAESPEDLAQIASALMPRPEVEGGSE